MTNFHSRIGSRMFDLAGLHPRNGLALPTPLLASECDGSCASAVGMKRIFILQALGEKSTDEPQANIVVSPNHHYA